MISRNGLTISNKVTMICFYEKTFEVLFFVNKKDAKQIQPRKNHTDN